VPANQLEVAEHPFAMLDLAPGQVAQGIGSVDIKPLEPGGMGFRPDEP
jgi:hypothetical protein